MSRSHHPVALALLKGLILLCLTLAAPLVFLIAIGIVAGAQALYIGGQFRGDQMLIAAGALLGIAMLAGLVIWRISITPERRQDRRHGWPRNEAGYGHPERHGAVHMEPAAPPAELTFHQYAMKIQFKLTHLEEKVNELETVLMRRAADLD
jgi:membrane protein implicated in regulation of membrane protease activity